MSDDLNRQQPQKPLFGQAPGQATSPYLQQMLSSATDRDYGQVHNPIQGFAKMGSQMADAYTLGKMLQRMSAPPVYGPPAPVAAGGGFLAGIKGMFK